VQRRPFLSASVSLGSVLGIPIRLHLTFLLLIAWLVWQAASRGGDGAVGLVLVLLLFSFVVLHELGHALMARVCRVRTREIVILPIGGLARLERMPSGAVELAIALSGPAVNLGLGLLFGSLGLLLFDVPADWSLGGGLRPAVVVWSAAVTNFALMAFNLLPAFPMDGGRVLRALLSFFMPLERATRLATRVGQAVAIVFVVLGFAATNPALALVGMLVFVGAANEGLFQASRTRLTGRVAEDAMITRFDTVAPQDSLADAARLLLASDQEVFPVVDAWGRLAGVLSRAGLFAGITKRGAETAILEVMEREFPVANKSLPLDELVDKLENAQQLPVFVIEDSRLVGFVTSENMAELVEISRLLDVPDE